MLNFSGAVRVCIFAVSAAAAVVVGSGSPAAVATESGVFTLAAYAPPTDGTTDATAAFRKLFTDVRAAGGGIVSIPPGRYFLAGTDPVPLPSRTRVNAAGATFVLPERLGDQARLVLFAAEDIQDFTWIGGTFLGHCFDPDAEANMWEPNVSTRVFLVTTSRGGRTEAITFRDVRSEGIAGAVVTVLGASRPGSEYEVDTYASDITIENCTLIASGKFMWDYGYLWQILVWPEDYGQRERQLAAKYFPRHLTREGLQGADGDDRVVFDNSKVPLPVARSGEPRDALVFFGDLLPENLRRGQQYFIVESEAGHVKIAERPGGPPIIFQGGFGPQAKLIHDHYHAFLGLYEPIGSGPGKGGIDLVACRDVRVTGCKLSARGDTMHIQKCRNIVFANNQILGSRMGAFFLAEYCRNATVTGNTVDGTNGSRVMSVEKSCADVTIVGNTFRNGGRGSWINQPTNFVLRGNVFVNNTTKCERDPHRGRKTFVTGDYEVYPELYFTLHQPDGRYGGVVVSGNVFDIGPECGPVITFEKNGTGILVSDNIVTGKGGMILVDPSCEEVEVKGNIGVDESP